MILARVWEKSKCNSTPNFFSHLGYIYQIPKTLAAQILSQPIRDMEIELGTWRRQGGHTPSFPRLPLPHAPTFPPYESTNDRVIWQVDRQNKSTARKELSTVSIKIDQQLPKAVDHFCLLFKFFQKNCVQTHY